MGEVERKNLKISGSGDGVGGFYDEVILSGSSDINGDIDCNYIKISGSSDVHGSIKTKSAQIIGSSDIEGNLSADEYIRISGSSDIHGDVNTKKIRISGSSDINGSLHAEEVELSGSSDIEKNCEAENFHGRGSFDIGGLLNADLIDIEITGRCSVEEIGGENIKVKMDNRNFSGIMSIFRDMFCENGSLRTNLIEGDEIYLEGTTADIVRGNNITIGKDCVVNLVEYKDNLKLLDNAKVNEQKKI